MFRLHTRLLCFLANMGLLHVQHVLFYCLVHHMCNLCICQALEVLHGAHAVVQPTKNSPKKMVAGSVRQVFCLCPVQNSVRGRDSACPEAHLQLSQFNLLCSRRYVLSTFFQCLQEGSFLQYAYDPVSTSLVCKR